MTKSRRYSLGVVAMMVALPGCMKDMPDGTVSRMGTSEPEVAAAGENPAPKQAKKLTSAEASPIIHALQSRPSVIEPGTPYARVAEAVIASDARVAEAELRVAQLRAEAAKRNWLPKIGPRISLSSLGDFVADLLINQVLFDNGRKVAERDLAKANVELAAVNLVTDGNQRVFEALSLYLKAEENRALSAHLAQTVMDMERYEWVIEQRVSGGVSDMSDLNVIRQKLADLRARGGEAQEATVTALAELNAMSARPLTDLRGIGGLGSARAGEALGVIRAQAERDMALAEARIARAAHLPGLSATGTARGGVGLEVNTDQLFGLGTMAEFKAIEATKETAERRVTEAREVAARAVQAQQTQLDAYRRQRAEAEGLTAAARENLDLFQRQFEGGQRQVMDVVGVYEIYASARERALDLKYKAARAELDLARLKGALAEGARI